MAASMAETGQRPIFSLLGIVFIFLAATLYLSVLSTYRPVLDTANGIYTEENGGNKKENFTDSDFQFPQNIDELKNLAKLLRFYQARNPLYIVVLFCSAYLYKQTFAIPGSVFMNLLAGALFGIRYGLPGVCLLTAMGASCCFLISKHFGRPVLLYYFPQRLHTLQNKIKENGDNLFPFLLFLRFFPMSPNWFLNMASPVLDIPLSLFFPSVLIGLLPYNFICVQTGCLLSQISSMNELFTVNVILKLIGIAMASLIPSILIKKIHGKREKKKSS